MDAVASTYNMQLSKDDLYEKAQNVFSLNKENEVFKEKLKGNTETSKNFGKH